MSALAQSVTGAERASAPLPASCATCPLCGWGDFTLLGVADNTRHALWQAPLPETLGWFRCHACHHVFTEGFYTATGLAELSRKSRDGQLAGGDLDQQRLGWTVIFQRVLQVLPDRAKLFETGLSWLDGGCGSGELAMSCEEFGFTSTGLDLREEAVQRMVELGYRAEVGEIEGIGPGLSFDVITLADVLEETPDPGAVLRRAHGMLAEQGVLFLSCPQRESGGPKRMDATQTDAKRDLSWYEIAPPHPVSRRSLLELLRRSGFRPADEAWKPRDRTSMEVIAVKENA